MKYGFQNNLEKLDLSFSHPDDGTKDEDKMLGAISNQGLVMLPYMYFIEYRGLNESLMTITIV